MDKYILYSIFKTDLNLIKKIKSIKILNNNCKLMNEKDAYEYLINDVLKRKVDILEKDRNGVYSYSLNNWIVVCISPLSIFINKFKLDECDWKIEEGYAKKLSLLKGPFVDCYIALDKLELFKECLIVPNIADGNKILNFIYYAYDHKHNLLAVALIRDL